MSPLVMYSNCFEIVSTVAFLVSQTRLFCGMFMFNYVILYHYSIKLIVIIQGIIRVYEAPGI